MSAPTCVRHRRLTFHRSLQLRHRRGRVVCVASSGRVTFRAEFYRRRARA